jgi:hypothetical protein
VFGEKRNAYRILVDTPEGREVLENNGLNKK